MWVPWSQPTVLPTFMSAPPKSPCAHQHPAHANLHIGFHTVCSRIKTCWHTSSDRASERSGSAHTHLTEALLLFSFFFFPILFPIPWSLPHFLISYVWLVRMRRRLCEIHFSVLLQHHAVTSPSHFLVGLSSVFYKRPKSSALTTFHNVFIFTSACSYSPAYLMHSINRGFSPSLSFPLELSAFIPHLLDLF